MVLSILPAVCFDSVTSQFSLTSFQAFFRLVVQAHLENVFESQEDFLERKMLPSCSPDLNPMDFSVSATLETRLYEMQKVPKKIAPKI